MPHPKDGDAQCSPILKVLPYFAYTLWHKMTTFSMVTLVSERRVFSESATPFIPMVMGPHTAQFWGFTHLCLHLLT